MTIAAAGAGTDRLASTQPIENKEFNDITWRVSATKAQDKALPILQPEAPDDSWDTDFDAPEGVELENANGAVAMEWEKYDRETSLDLSTPAKILAFLNTYIEAIESGSTTDESLDEIEETCIQEIGENFLWLLDKVEDSIILQPVSGSERSRFVLHTLKLLKNPNDLVDFLWRTKAKTPVLHFFLDWMNKVSPGIKELAIKLYGESDIPEASLVLVRFLNETRFLDCMKIAIRSIENDTKTAKQLAIMRSIKRADDFEALCSEGIPVYTEDHAPWLETDSNNQGGIFNFKDNRYFPGKFRALKEGYRSTDPVSIDALWKSPPSAPDFLSKYYRPTLLTLAIAAVQLKEEQGVDIVTAESPSAFQDRVKGYIEEKRDTPLAILAVLDERSHATPLIFLPKPGDKYEVAILGSVTGYWKKEVQHIAPFLDSIEAVYITNTVRQADGQSCYSDAFEILKNISLEMKNAKPFSFEDFKWTKFSPQLPTPTSVPFYTIKQPLRWQPFAQVISAMDERDDATALTIRNGYLVSADLTKKFTVSIAGKELSSHETQKKVVCVGLAVRAIQMINAATTAPLSSRQIVPAVAATGGGNKD